MAHYIDKDALVAETKRRRDAALMRQQNLKAIGQESVINEMVANELNKIISLINTLEVKEVELTWEDVREICKQSVLVEIDLGGLVSDERHYTEVLKRFKVQKGK